MGSNPTPSAIPSPAGDADATARLRDLAPSPTTALASPAPSPPHAPRVFGLDLLRALAILSVVGAHAAGVLYPHLPLGFGVVGHGGFYGVELFFVLSGFLIGQILLRENSALAHASRLTTFYIRRWLRTLPLFALFLMLNLVLEALVLHRQIPPSEVLSHGLFLSTFARNNVLFFPESWSLAVEEWFYLLFPAALWICLQFWKRFDRVFLTVAAAFFIFSTVGRVLSVHDPRASWADWQRVIVILRFDALMTGMFAAWIAARAPVRWRQHRQLYAVAGGLLLLAMYSTLWKVHGGRLEFGDDDFFARTFRFNLVSLGFALLLPWAASWKVATENAGSAAVRRIALWSYALYLVHPPVFNLAIHFLLPAWGRSIAGAAGLFALLVFSVISSSALLYRFFESPCTRLRERVAPAVARLLH